jgi:hypothetical protein
MFLEVLNVAVGTFVHNNHVTLLDSSYTMPPYSINNVGSKITRADYQQDNVKQRITEMNTVGF